MLIYFLLQIPIMIINVFTAWIPKISTLPFGLDEILTQGFGYLQFIILLIPPIGAMYTAFLWVVGFKISMRLVLMIPIVGRMFR